MLLHFALVATFAAVALAAPPAPPLNFVKRWLCLADQQPCIAPDRCCSERCIETVDNGNICSKLGGSWDENPDDGIPAFPWNHGWSDEEVKEAQEKWEEKARGGGEDEDSDED